MFEGLLLSRDDAVIRMFRRIYQEMELAGLEVCTGAEQAQQELNRKRFHAIIVDCDDVHCAPEVLGSIRKTAPNQRSTIFAILNGITTMRGAFEMGANLTLQKPMSLEHVRKSLRALRTMMEQEHRRYFRVPVDIPATLVLDEKQEFQTIGVNISDGGMALHLTYTLPEHRSASVRFFLPGGANRLEMKVKVAWTDASGNAGLRFEYMPPGVRQELNAWLARNIESPRKQAVGTSGLPAASKSLR